MSEEEFDVGVVSEDTATMEEIAEAFRVVGWLANLNGRRLERAHRLARSRWIPVLHGSPMLTAKMAKRAERRDVARFRNRQRRAEGRHAPIPFRPVYGYRGVQNDD